ncbi:MAG TPA: hypothetical protein VH251_02390 [Verrucomicrobiae bacterium]|nr:hypothetical protein [Verrucomicrobiae bacterium]
MIISLFRGQNLAEKINFVGSSLISVEGPAPSQGPDANGFVNGRFGRQSLEHGADGSKCGRKDLVESPWKNFARPTAPLAIKCKYRHCPISMPVFSFLNAVFSDTRKMGRWLRLNDRSSQARPGVLVLSWKQDHDSTASGIPSRRDWKASGKLALPIPPKAARNQHLTPTLKE